jgi:AraC family transcriptional regulator
MTFDYGSETLPSDFVNPPTLLNCVRLPAGQVKLMNFQAKVVHIWACADALPLHYPKQHVVCLHHFDQPMKFDRSLDGRTRREITARGDIAFLPSGALTRLRPALNDPNRVLFYSYLIIEPAYLQQMALSNGISSELELVSAFAKPDPLLHEIAAALTPLPPVSDPAEPLFIETMLNAVCARVLRSYATVQCRLSGPPRLTDGQLRRAIEYIQENLSATLDLASISQAAGLSAFHFSRLFKQATGDAPFQFVTRARMQSAKQLLSKTLLPISEIAQRVGYQKPSHFSRRFRAVCGCSPAAYRRER